MNKHIESYFEEFSDDGLRGNFHRVIALHRSPDMDWKTLAQKIPGLPKGWFELAQLPLSDRLEFTRDFWNQKLPFLPDCKGVVDDFFSTLDDVGIYVVQKTFEDPFEALMVYSVVNEGGFFLGETPASDDQLITVQNAFPEIILPRDYVAFLEIHNGFSKTTDCTGVVSTETLPKLYREFQGWFADGDLPKNNEDELIDPKSLIPFYESFGMPYYQCFFSEWYPGDEMGNVYYSRESNSISDIRKSGSRPECLSFPTFLDWLKFYIERID